jgi:hypothetical protein
MLAPTVTSSKFVRILGAHKGRARRDDLLSSHVDRSANNDEGIVLVHAQAQMAFKFVVLQFTV